MKKIGRHRNPAFMMILSLASFCFFATFWICIVLTELRNYRQKGISGYLAFGIVVLAVGAIVHFLYTTPLNAGITLIIMLLLFFEPLFFYISSISGKELNKLKSTNKDWAMIGIIPTLAIILLFIVPFISLYPTSSWLEANDEGIVLILAIILISVWVFIMQKLLNSIWELGNKSQTLAEPEMLDKEDSIEVNNS